MKVSIFCGSASGNQPLYAEATAALGCFLANNGIDLVYGGGDVGLMGAIADSFLANNAKVYGVMPQHLVKKELAHKNLTELKIVSDMHERKAEMAEMADAFIALPGGVGTLEEIFEVWTWGMLGLHQKPCAFFNVNGYYDPLLSMVDSMIKTGFLKSDYKDMLITTDDAKTLLASLHAYKAPQMKWS